MGWIPLPLQDPSGKVLALDSTRRKDALRSTFNRMQATLVSANRERSSTSSHKQGKITFLNPKSFDKCGTQPPQKKVLFCNATLGTRWATPEPEEKLSCN